MPHRPYRLCAGIMLLNANNHVFVGQRIDNPSPAWQMPQGGIDTGETPVQAAMRELFEEIGTSQADIIAHYPEPLDYNLPPDLADKFWNGQYCGQRQYWFLMRFTGTDSDINLNTQHPEFSAYRWVKPHTLPDYAVSFKKEIYQKLIDGFKDYF